MTTYALWIHLINLVLPAGLTAVCLVVLTPILVQKPRLAYGFGAQALFIFAVGVVVTLGGLWVTGQDGKVQTYAWMALAMGLAQALWVWLRQR